MDRPVLTSRPAILAWSVLIVIAALSVSRVLGTAFTDLLRTLELQLSTTPRIVLKLFLQQGVVFGGISGVYLWIRNRDIDWVGVSIPDVKQLLWIVGCWILALGAASTFGMVLLLLGFDPGENNLIRRVSVHPQTLLVLIPVTILLIGPGEELLFRGIIQRSLRERFGPVSAILLASAIFASAHFTSLSGSVGSRLLTIVLLAIPTLVFATAYERTGNIVVPALVHGLYNATLFSFQYLAIKFGGVPPVF